MTQPNPATEDAGDLILQCQEVWGGNHRVERRVRLPGLQAWLYSRPCDRTAAGGDVHYVSACAGGQLARLLVADVAGHGPAVAATAEALRDLMRQLVNDADQRHLVEHLNRRFTAISTDADTAQLRFATAVVLTYDSWAGRLLACNAGHPPPLWYRAADRRWQTLEPVDADGGGSGGRNLPVGIFGETDYEQFELALAVGDLVLCYTDSLIEARDAAGRLLGMDGLLDVVRAADASDPDRLVTRVVDALGRLDARNHTQDDMTCLLVRVTGVSRPAAG